MTSGLKMEQDLLLQPRAHTELKTQEGNGTTSAQTFTITTLNYSCALLITIKRLSYPKNMQGRCYGLHEMEKVN